MAVDLVASLASWRQTLEADATELARSERVQNQLGAVLASLQKKVSDLDDERVQLQSKASGDGRLKGIDEEVTSAREAVVRLEVKRDEALKLLGEEQSRCQASNSAKQGAIAELAQCEAAKTALQEEHAHAENKCADVIAEARSMVSAEALERTRVQSREVNDQLRQQQDETARLRQALIDSWAARVDDDGETQTQSSADNTACLQRMEEELNWLAKMQRDAAQENRHLQKLERQQAALQAQLKEASDEKAELQSARVDLGDSAKAMREAIASQSEGYVRRVGDLEGARRSTDEDRIKLLDECADLQAKFDAMTPDLEAVQELETRHSALDGEKQALANEGARLRTVNAAFGAQLLGDDAPAMAGGDGSAGTVAEAVSRLVQLQSRLIERVEAHAAEKEKLAERIRQLERDAAQPDEVAPATSLRDLQGSRPAPQSAGPLAAASSVFKGGLGKLREAVPLR